MKILDVHSKGEKYEVKLDDEDYNFIVNTLGFETWAITSAEKSRTWKSKKYVTLVLSKKRVNILKENGIIIRKNQKRISIHRLIMNPGYFKGNKKVVDHINGDTFDNTRENLRVTTVSKNNANQGLMSNNTTGYKGVHKKRDIHADGTVREFYTATISENKKNKHLGCFKTPEEAAKAYDEKAKIIHGDHCYLNFPNESEEMC